MVKVVLRELFGFAQDKLRDESRPGRALVSIPPDRAGLL
jgi:hypothetical protein